MSSPPLIDRGLRVRRLRLRLRGACPVCARSEPRRHDQALSAAEGDIRPLVLHAFAATRAMTSCLTHLASQTVGAAKVSSEGHQRRGDRDPDGRASRVRLERRGRKHSTSPRLSAALGHAERTLLADAADLVRLRCGESGGRLVFAVRDDAGGLIGLERYAMPGSRARRLASACPSCSPVAGSRRSLWPAPGDVQVGGHLPGTLLVCEGPPPR